MDSKILVKVKPSINLEIWQVSEMGQIPFSMESGGVCLGRGVTTDLFRRGGK
jgi:hypothetical protein